jgi:hypothetical protein
MNYNNKAVLIGCILEFLNNKIRTDNKILCVNNLHWKQTPLHGVDTWFKLAFMTDEQIKEIAKELGL